MALTINLTAAQGSSAGIDFDAYVQDYFDDFTFGGWPYILGGSGPFEGDQMVILDEIEPNPEDTKSIVLDGRDFFYEFSAHEVTGTLNRVRLSTLSDSYQDDGSFDQDASGHIDNTYDAVDISGFDLTDGFHDLVAALMGTDSDDGLADPRLLLALLGTEAHVVMGSQRGDVYAGTRFGDSVNGNAGNDELDGAAGNDLVEGGAGHDELFGGVGNDRIAGGSGNGADTLDGGAGNDRLDGANGADSLIGGNGIDTLSGGGHGDLVNGGLARDSLTGGAGPDTFLFADIRDSRNTAAGRDRITDFDSTDRISLADIDADTGRAGNQAFDFIGAAGFSREAGELRYVKQGASTFVQADVNGDGQADLGIHLVGAHTFAIGDFLL